MSHPCPLKKIENSTPPSHVPEMEQISFEHYNGGGLYHLKCKVCGLVVRVEEDPGYHYPYYYWPTVCMRKTVVTNPDDGAAPSHT